MLLILKVDSNKIMIVRATIGATFTEQDIKTLERHPNKPGS
jgi:hypothetical protein